MDYVTAGPYYFTVSLYDDPARARFALPFAIAPQGAAHGSWTYQVASVPQGTRLRNGKILMSGNCTATLVNDSVSPDPQDSGCVEGDAEITVQGQWNLQMVVDGPSGRQTFDVPITATTLPAIAVWSGWALGCIPVCGILVFLLIQVWRKRQGEQVASQVR